METIFSGKQLLLVFSVSLFLVVGLVSAALFTGLSLGLPEVFYVIAACILTFLVLSIALTIHLFLQRNN